MTAGTRKTNTMLDLNGIYITD